MDIQLISVFVTPTLILFGMGLAYSIFVRQTRISEERLASERQERREQTEIQRLQMHQAGFSEALKKQVQQPAGETPILDHSGYILLTMPNSQKPIFLDLLKGFEEFAQIKGYGISFAYDGSLADKVAFRFTILGDGIAVSTERVKRDLQDYVNRVQKGHAFDDLPVIIPPTEHHSTLLILKNRLNFLQSSYTAQRNVLQLYETVIRDFKTLATTQPQQFYITNGAQMNPTSYSAVNSSQIAQGSDNKLIGNTNSQSIYIGNSFGEREEIVKKLGEVWMALYQSEKTEANKEKADEAIRLLDKIKGELTDEPQPDTGRLQRWVQKLTEIFRTAALAKVAVDAFDVLLKAFRLN